MKRILQYVWKYKGSLIFGTISMLIIIGIDLFSPYLQKIFLDKGIIGGKESLIIPILICFAAISIVKAVLGYGKEYIYDRLASFVQEDIKHSMFNHIQKLEFKYFDEMNTGELMSRIGEDAENIWQTIGFGLRLFVENIIYFVISTIILFYLNWKLALACFVVMIPIGFIAVQLEKKFGKCYGEISDKTAEINTTAQEDIAGIRLVKAFSREKYEISRFLKLNRSYYDLNMKLLPFGEVDFMPDRNHIEKKPQNFEKMLELAEVLSEGLPFIRVDFYNVDGKIYFGELTFFPASGLGKFTDEKWDVEIGNMLEL